MQWCWGLSQGGVVAEQCSGVGGCFSAAAPPYPMGPPPGYAPPSYSHPGSEPYPPGVGGPPPVPPRQQSGSLPNGSAEVQFVCMLCDMYVCIMCVVCHVYGAYNYVCHV